MENLNNVPSTGTFGNSVQKINSNFDLIVNAINSLEYQTTRSKGILNYGQNPATVFPNAVAGDWCMILSQGNVFPATIKTYNGSTWSGSGTWNPDGVDLTGYATTSAMNTAIANSLAQATARMGYGECTVSGTALTVSIPNFILPTSGGTIHIKMSAAGTGASTLNINSTGAKTLWYNGAAVSSDNTWEAGEIISVFYDGTRFMASNSQGGGGKLKVDDNDGLSDLDIADENDFVLAQFENGHIKTKNFNSADISNIKEDNSNSEADFEISDNNNNVIVQFLGGHIITKNFNSRKIGYEKTTIIPILIGGNPINTSNAAGNQIKFGTAESNALKYIHSQIYNVLGDTNISFACDIDTVDLGVIFIDKFDRMVSTFNLHEKGSSWDGCSMVVPSNATGMVLQIDAVDNNNVQLNSINLYMTGFFFKNCLTRFFPRSEDDGYQHLTMKIGLTPIQNSYDVDAALKVETTYAVDHGVLCLPESYTPEGKPTRLICFCHGHAVTYASVATRFNANDIKPEYWLSEGYAIFDMDGSVTGAFSGNHDYEPAVVNAYDTAYQWIVTHFNIRTDGVFTTGRSMGGGMQFVLAKRSSMPILASAPMVPYCNPLGYVGGSMKDAQRKQLLQSYGLTETELSDGGATWTGTTNKVFHQLTNAQKNVIINNQRKFVQYAPGWVFERPITLEEADYWSRTWIDKDDSDMDAYYENVKGSLNVSLFNNVPFFLLTCVGDPTVWYKEVVTMHRLLTYAGSLAYIHVYPETSDRTIVTTDHRFEINPENLITYTNSKGVTIDNVPKVYIEILAFWRRFENQDKNTNN